MRTFKTPSVTPSMRKLPIGIFDSGIGGLTVVKQLHKVLPNEDLIYLGDTARVPYGTKSPTTVVRFAREDTEFLLGQNIKAIVVACNTASAWALPALQKQFPLPIFGVIRPGAEAALARTRNGRIGVIGTRATIRSEAYPDAIHELNSRVKVFAHPCPLLVPLVEEGWVRHAITDAVLKLYLAPLLRCRIDTLVLGCTHYPLLKPAIKRVVGDGVKLVDSAETCADFVQTMLQRLGLLSQRRLRPGTIQPFVTDEADRFEASAARLLGARTAPAEKITLPVPVQRIESSL